MTNHEKAVAWQKDHIGEHEEPMGSNTGPFVIKCQRATDLPGTGWPWCVADWLAGWLYGAGIKLPYSGASAYGCLDWFSKNLPTWVVPKASWRNARPGAAVIFNIGSGHLATLAKAIVPGDMTVSTIDGNSSDMVKPNVRSLSLVRGIVDPPETIPDVTPVHKPKVFEVATSESGHRKLIYVSGGKAIGRKIEQILNRRGGVTITPRKTG